MIYDDIIIYRSASLRTIIDIPEPQVKALEDLSRGQNQSRAALIREAIQEYLARRRPQADDGFGLWGEGGVDGLAYQEKARSEW